MSYCEIITFENGKPASSVEYRNAYGGAARIWTALFDTYLKDPSVAYDSWMMRGMSDSEDRSLWDLANRADLPLFERAVHMATFDYATIKRADFKRFAAHLRAFVEKYPAGKCVCHLRSWAGFIESCESEIVGFYMMSVSENPWYSFDDETEESVPYDLNVRSEHFDVYERVDAVAQEQEEKDPE